MEKLSKEQFMIDIQEFLNSYVKGYDIPLKREKPREFASRLVRTFVLFTLPLVPDSLMVEALKTKCLYGLWNTVIDDRIDCDHEGKEELIDIFGVIQDYSSENEMHPRTVTGQILKDFLSHFLEFPLGPNSDIAKELLFLDLLRTANAFNYERIALTKTDVVTLAEHLEFSTSTIDVRPLLDIDLALIRKQVNPIMIGKLREIYKLLGIAFRFFNDLATFDREFYSEKSLNSVILYGIEKGVLPQEVLHLSETEKTKIYQENILPLCHDIEAQIDDCRQTVFSKISQITEMDLKPMAENFDLLVKRASSDSFVKN